MIMGFWYGMGKVEKESNNVCFTGGGVFIKCGGGVKGAASPQTFPSDFLNGKKERKKQRKFIPFTS